MKLVLAAVLVVHGLIHLIGFAKAFGLARVDAIAHVIPPALGLVWLLAALLFVTSAALLFVVPRAWWAPTLAAVILSQVAIASAWSDAKVGTVANLVILVPLAAALLALAPSSFPSVFRREVEAGLRRTSTLPAITEADLLPLPSPVQRYLRYSGAVGQSRVQNARARFRGEMRPKPDAGWMPVTVEQYNFFDAPERVFLLDATRFGLPFEALHLYAGDSATMRVKVASLVPIVDAAGPEMNRGETVTMFNDMCVLAPGTLIGDRIRWEPIDAHTAKATFTNAGQTISATLTFADDGALTSFASDDRYESADGKTYRSYRWTTPLRDYRDYHGHKLAAHGDAIWGHPEGDYVYARFDLVDVEYNLGADAAP